MGATLTVFEQKLIDEIAVDLFDKSIAKADIVAKLERAAALLNIPVSSVVVYYLPLKVFNHTPRHEGLFGVAEGDLEFDTAYARESLRRHSKEGLMLRPLEVQSKIESI